MPSKKDGRSMERLAALTVGDDDRERVSASAQRTAGHWAPFWLRMAGLWFGLVCAVAVVAGCIYWLWLIWS